MRSRPDLLAEYVELQNAEHELTSWTVALVNNRSQLPRKPEDKVDPHKLYTLGQLRGGCTERNDANTASTAVNEPYTLSKQHLISPDDEVVDLSEDQRKNALLVTRQLWEVSSKKNKTDDPPTRANGKGARASRSPSNGLFLVYQLYASPNDHREDSSVPVTAFAISFPASENAKTVDYRVNNVYWDEEFGGEQ
jgi:hypothetical protein